MNLFLKSYNFYLFFFFFIALNTSEICAKNEVIDIPVKSGIVQYNIPVEYNRSPNLSFCRSHNGITYIGKSYGMLVIDEDQIHVSYSTHPIKAAKVNNQRIGYITKNDFGYLDYDPYSGIKYTSLATDLPVEMLNFESGYIVSNNESTFFTTANKIFAVYNDSIHTIDFDNNSYKVFNGGKVIYAHVKSKGIYKWKQDQFELIPGTTMMKEAEIENIVDRQGGFIVISDQRVTHFEHHDHGVQNIKLSKSLSGKEIKNGWFITEETMLCLGSDNQVLIYESTLKEISGKGSMPLTELKSVFKDQFNDIWLVYDFNIFKGAYPANYLSLDLSDFISGTILTAESHYENLYIGTNEGLFCINEKNNHWQAEELFNNSGNYIHHLTSYGNLLLGSGNKGLYKIQGKKISMFEQGNFDFIRLLNDHTFIAAKDNILRVYIKKNDTWITTNHELPVKQIVNSIFKEEKLYLLTQKNMLVEASPEGFHEAELQCIPRFLKPKLLKFDGEIFVFCNNRLYQYNLQKRTFSENENLPVFEYLEKSDYLINIENRLWSAERKYDGSFAIRELNNERFRAAFLKVTADDHFGQIIDMEQSRDFTWIIGNRKIVRMKHESDADITNKTLRFQSVTDVNQNIIQESQKIKYKNNHVIFSLGNIRYKKDPYPYYRYKITHYQEEWSDWGNDKIIEFDNLRERIYVFSAQSLSHAGQVSETITFSFTVEPPSYRMWYAYIVYIVLLIILGFLIYKWRLLNLKKVEYQVEEKIRLRMEPVLAEKEKSDRLVEDLLPKATADELKSSGRAKTKKFKMATVLFSDIQGFTRIAEEMNPEVLIDELDKFFFHFDSVVEKYNIEKIKTIGDAYMAAGGIPIKNSSNPVEVVLAGLEMQNYMRDLKKKKADIWDLRIGIHTGPVISGVVGHKKLSYDIWGDTVNTASRMESSGEGGKVNISGVTYSMVKDYFICEYRGKLPVKYKGNIDMYFVKGLRPELSVDLQYIPNKRFFTKLQLLRLKDLEEMIYERLYEPVSQQLHFHNKNHIIRLFNQTELLGRSENISEEDLLITQTAALLLYSGLLERNENYENYSINFAKEVLPSYSYSEKQTVRVCNLILATKMPFKPQNLLEKIMIDAKMEYLGRSDYHSQIKALFKEINNSKKEISKDKFIKSQIQLQKEFSYYTIAAQRLREIPPEKQIELLTSWE